MTGVVVANRVVRVGRLGTAAAWISAGACLPYLVLKVLWTLDLPVGVIDRSQLHTNGWVAGNAVMAVVQVVAVLLVIALVRPWSYRVPTWLLLFPVWVGTGLLFQVVVGSALMGLTSAATQGAGFDTGGIAPWVFLVVYTAFAVQGAALAIAFTCHVRGRWGHLLNQRSADVLTPPTGGGRQWPGSHLRVSAEPVAVLALIVALVFAYWAAGGSVGLSDARPQDSFEMQASRMLGAVLATAGLLGLAGRWGRKSPFWVAAGLTWLGSGALVAFDLFTVVLNHLLSVSGAAHSESDWAPIDTVLMLKVGVGVLTALVGLLALAAAAKSARVRAPTSARYEDRDPAECTRSQPRPAQ